MRTLLLLVGLALLAGAGIRREQLLRRRRADVKRGLRSSDPSARALAIEQVAAVGLRPYAPVLLQRAAELDDPDLIAELAGLVARCQWEPADDPGVVQLRLWATSVGVTEPAPAAPDPVEDPAPPLPPPPTPSPSDDNPVANRIAAALGVLPDRVRFTPIDLED